MRAGLRLLRVKRMREREVSPCFTASGATAKAGGLDGKLIVLGIGSSTEPWQWPLQHTLRGVEVVRRQATLGSYLFRGENIFVIHICLGCHSSAILLQYLQHCCWTICILGIRQKKKYVAHIQLLNRHWDQGRASEFKGAFVCCDNLNMRTKLLLMMQFISSSPAYSGFLATKWEYLHDRTIQREQIYTGSSF